MIKQKKVSEYKLNCGARLFVMPTDKFKVVNVTMLFHRPLGADATMNAFFPAVLERGTKKHPDMASITEFLESLYGGSVDDDSLKIGDRQIITFAASFINDRLVPGHDNLRKGLAFLNEMVYSPVTAGKGFKKEYFDQEKGNYRNALAAVVNEKIQYANKKFIELMFAGEPFGIDDDGNIPDLDAIQNAALYSHYTKFLDETALDMFVVGDVKPDEMFKRVNALFKHKIKSPVAIPATFIDKKVDKVKVQILEDDIEQGKLVMGFRDYTTLADDDIFAMMFFNSLFGGSPSARIFKHVREKHGLAYYASSGIDRSKGYIKVGAGVNWDKLLKAVTVTMEQKNDLMAGNIADDEWKSSLNMLKNYVNSLGDSPSAMTQYLLEQQINGRFYAPEDMMERFLAVRKEDVMKAASKLRLDTIFFLTPKGTKGKCDETMAELIKHS